MSKIQILLGWGYSDPRLLASTSLSLQAVAHVLLKEKQEQCFI